MTEKYYMTWREVFELVDQIPPYQRVYGVPRGGGIVAALYASRQTGMLVDADDNPDLILDDILDSGRTRDRFQQSNPEAMFYTLVNREMGRGPKNAWVVFPWEAEPEREATDYITRLLEYLGQDVSRAGLQHTPERVLKALQEAVAGDGLDSISLLQHSGGQVHFPEQPVDEMIILRGIQFSSTCEHHLMPFFGNCAFAYIPGEAGVVGVSKLARLVTGFAQRLQVQERMTNQIVDAFQQIVRPRGCGLVVQAQHTCIRCRGIRQPSTMLTSALRGVFIQPEVRQEFFKLAYSAENL
jgi:GTP cyclohydrolase I